MEQIDFDGMFDEKLTEYMEKNKGKYTEAQWEDVIAKLYKKFGDTYIAKIKCTPKEYYAKMSDTQLVETLKAHLQEDIPVAEFLCGEIEKRGVVELLTPLLLDKNKETALYAFNLIGDNISVYDTYFKMIEEEGDIELQNDIIEIFKFHADEVKDRAYENYQKGIAKEYMLEILSRVKTRDEKIYYALITAFKEDANLSMRASYLAAYGDERALPILLNKIESNQIGFIEFQELKYAIESLGGEYNKERDFSLDKDYLAIETVKTKNNASLKS